jgi:hypothetical protein
MSGSFAALRGGGVDLDGIRSRTVEFLKSDRAAHGWEPAVDAWLSRWDTGFSARLGSVGLLGLAIPREYGGHGLGHLHRHVVAEELLVHGAPVAAHWFADRQVAPALLSYGSEPQRRDLLPRIAAGLLHCAIGMSEDGAGSDLSAARTRADRTEGGWLLNGRKTWTSGAHRAHLVVVLARTGPARSGHRHDGFSQFLVPTDSPGVSIGAITQMSGAHHFNEVVFDDVFVPYAALLGAEGDGWRQVTSELSFERSGPERILSTSPLIAEVLRGLPHGNIERSTAARVGELCAQLTSLRHLSVSVATALTDGGDATSRAALVKDLGTRFEQDSVETCDSLACFVDDDSPAEHLARLRTQARLQGPTFTLRGGTNEVLRGVVAREMGLR